jgi:hypothetical protein
VIDFRYHVVSIVAVFLALALGLFIGATSLRGTVRGDITTRTESVVHSNAKLRSQIGDLNNQIKNATSVDTALLPYAVQGRLAGESVVVISAPGIDSDIRNNVLKALPLAGATVAADVRLQDHLLDPQQDQFLGSLADQVAIAGRPLPNASGGVRALALLADVLVTSPRQRAVPRTAAARVLSAFSAGSLLSISGDSTEPGTVAVLIAPPGPAPSTPSPSPAPDTSTLLATFARDLDANSTGVVVAGPQTSDQQGGLVDQIRSDKTLRSLVSTVDDADLPSGIIATVLALGEQTGEQTGGQAGSYGIGPGRDSPVPPPSP